MSRILAWLAVLIAFVLRPVLFVLAALAGYRRERSLVRRGLAQRYRGRLIPVMRGGDSLFPELPEDLSGLTDDELSAHLAASVEAKDKIVAQDPEFLGELSATEILDVMKNGVTGILALKAEQATRVEAQSNLAAELASLAAQVEPEPDPAVDPSLEADDPDPAVDPDPADPVDPDADPAPEPVVAAAEPVAPRPLRRLPASGRHAARPSLVASTAGPVFKASAGVENFSPGQVMDMREGEGPGTIGYALGRAIERSVATPPGFREPLVVAAMDVRDQSPPDIRILDNDNMRANEEKVRTLVAAAKRGGVGYGDMALTASGEPDYAAAEALTASGGICAPVTPYYQLAFISEMARPVRDSLVGFIADRGGIQFAPPPYISQITTGVGVITAAQDAAGGTSGTKTCQTLICPAFQTVNVESIFHCFQGGNLGQRAFPEQASQFSSLILAQHARVAETQLLNQIKAGSTNVEGQSTVLGAFSSLLNDMLTAAAAYRNNNRMAPNAVLQAIAPAWTADVLLIDLLQSNFYRFDKTQQGLMDLFAAFNLRVTYTLDGPTDGDGQVLARQAGSLGPSAPGALAGTFPTVVEWALFHPGAWLFVDSGVLELGIVRDSTLNATNSYQVFGESWEAAAGIGVQSLWVYSNICATGATALSIANTHQCGS